MRNMVYLLCGLPWNSGEKVSSGNSNRQTAIWLNFGVICTAPWYPSYHHDSELATQAFLVVSGVNRAKSHFFMCHFIQPVLVSMRSGLSVSGLCREQMDSRSGTKGSCTQTEESSPKFPKLGGTYSVMHQPVKSYRGKVFYCKIVHSIFFFTSLRAWKLYMNVLI